MNSETVERVGETAGKGVSVRELATLDAGALLAPLPDTARLTVTGADRLDFLHGQLANDVKGIRDGGWNRSLLLNHKGHALALVQVLRSGDRLELLVEGDAVELVEGSLRRHIVFDQVTLTPGAVTSLTLQGPSARDVVSAVTGKAPDPGEFAVWQPVEDTSAWIVPVGRSNSGGFDIHVAGDVEVAKGPLLEGGAVEGSSEAVELARILARRAEARTEGGEGVLPQEAGLEEYLSYRKGCYLGQEIMARIEARGKLRRALHVLSLSDVPEPGERELRIDGKVVGRLGAVGLHPTEGPVALAVVRDDLGEDVEISVGGATARVVPTG